MAVPSIGKKVPDFTLPATGGEMVRLSELRGAPVVLYFYPKDDTPGCTLEGQDFRDQAPAFRKLKAVVLVCPAIPWDRTRSSRRSMS